MTSTTPTAIGDSAAELQREMSAVRQDLRRDLRRVRSQARQLADWRHLVGRSPWLSLAVAAAAGYFVVPRRRRRMTVEAESRTQDSESEEPSGATGNPSTAAAEFRSTMFQLGKTFAIRTAATLAARQLTRFMNPGNNEATEDHGNSSQHESES